MSYWIYYSASLRVYPLATYPHSLSPILSIKRLRLSRCQSELLPYSHRELTNLYNYSIPPDLQLQFFFTERTLVDSSKGLAIKDETVQHIDITRLIFYYRLDEAHQFQRYHDSHRWNIAIFLAILSTPYKSRDSRNKTYIPPAACRYIISYLGAVLEHHTTPTLFGQRNSFVKLWKNSRYDFFTFAAGQKKILKGVMKYLSTAWEVELKRAKMEMGEEDYARRVAKFVGVLIPGRQDQRAHVNPYVFDAQDADVKREDDGSELRKGALLAALEEPLILSNDVVQPDGDTETVMKTHDALTAVKTSEPRSILSTLMRAFPSEEDWRTGAEMTAVSMPYRIKGEPIEEDWSTGMGMDVDDLQYGMNGTVDSMEAYYPAPPNVGWYSY
jgi:hypothetical protein